MSTPDQPKERGIPLFKEDGRGGWVGRLKVNREILKELRRSEHPLAPYELSGKLINSDVYRGVTRKKDILSHVKDVLEGMERRSVVEKAGIVPAKLWGAQETYRLTAYGRMIASLSLFEEPTEQLTRDDLRRDVLGFIIKYCKMGNVFTDFDFEVMVELLNHGDEEIIERFFLIAVIYFNLDSLTRPTKGWVRYLGEMWTTYLNFPGDTGYAKAFLKVFGSLPEDRKRIIAMYVKTRLERDWLLGIQPDEKYIQAVALGGEPVHLPTHCPKCRDTVVVEKSVEKMYSDIAKGVRAKCPTCSSVLSRPRWVPWYGEWMGEV